MNTAIIASEKNLQEQLIAFKKKADYVQIADLLTFSLKNASSEVSRNVFGYIPSLFREIEISNPLSGITPSLLSIDEPIIYKISFPKNQTIRGIPYFYLFCYLKQSSSQLNVYFQSAAVNSRALKQKQYTIANRRINFEGIISAFKDSRSAICISDPGHFVPDLISSFYVGSRQINFPELICNTIENICILAGIKLEDTFLFGSSAGGMGALLSSTYFSSKVQVMAVNAQIITYDLRRVMNKLLGTDERDVLLKKFANRISCLNRFQQNINSIANIYLLANVNDSLHHRNYKFYQLYQELFVYKGKANQSIFDSYYGVEGHGRPDKVSLKQKMDIARASLTMKSNIVEGKQHSSIQSVGQHQNKTLHNHSELERILTFKQQLLKENGSSVARNSDRHMPLLKDLDRYQVSLGQVDQHEFKLKRLNAKQYPQTGSVSPDDAVIVGKDGWMFINSGSNRLMEYHTGKIRLPLTKVAKWSQLLSERIRWHNARKIGYQHIFIPNKIAVYPEHYPEALNIVGKRPILQLQQKCDRLFAYPLELFNKYKAQYQLYEKQDCHWSFWGCYLAYLYICQQLDIMPNLEMIDAPIETIKIKGDLGNKFGLIETTLRKNLKLNSQVIYDNQVIKYGNQGSVRILKNDTIAQGKIIIFGDSFCNPGFPDYSSRKRLIARLTTLFAETLNEVHFVWTPWIDYDYIEREKPDFVLSEMAERFLVRVPDDFDHLPLEEFAAMKLKQHQSKQK